MESGVDNDIGKELIAEMRTRYGSIENYLEHDYGLDRQRLAKLRDRYLMEVAD